MRRCRSWYRIQQLLHSRLPLPPGPLTESLALWLQGLLLAENGCLDRVAAAWGGGEGMLWVGRGVASPGHSPLPGTLVVLHGSGHEHPWVLLTDTPPDRTKVTLYACRDWIEQGFRGLKRAGWQWPRTRRTDPVRAGRHWLVLAVATLLAVAHGTRREEAAALGRNPARLRAPPATVPARSAPRRLSLLRQGMACLGALLARGRSQSRAHQGP